MGSRQQSPLRGVTLRLNWKFGPRFPAVAVHQSYRDGQRLEDAGRRRQRADRTLAGDPPGIEVPDGATILMSWIASSSSLCPMEQKAD